MQGHLNQLFSFPLCPLYSDSHRCAGQAHLACRGTTVIRGSFVRRWVGRWETHPSAFHCCNTHLPHIHSACVHVYLVARLWALESPLHQAQLHGDEYSEWSHRKAERSDAPASFSLPRTPRVSIHTLRFTSIVARPASILATNMNFFSSAVQRDTD